MVFPAAPVVGRKLFDPWASGRLGQDVRRKFGPKVYVYVVFSSLIKGTDLPGRTRKVSRSDR